MPPSPDDETQDVSPAGMPRHPERIGPYRIREVLGEGGMGIVYLAEQTEPLHRRVALKVIKLGMDTREVLARFEAERQALAVLDHPNIARVYDGGATENGLPYFAMEIVRGVPITEYCDRHKLPVKERLRLFVQVCRGMHHVHHRGIIHRDIKPSNVVVGTREDEVAVKIIDFGVARATNQRLTERTLYTEIGRVIGTPAYMSPEQAEMTAEDIDYRTDIYSLGVLLYELLVGELPLDWEGLSKLAFDEVLRRIRVEEPLAPSVRWTRLNLEWAKELADLRLASVAEFKSHLRGELDWITMKALEKDRRRRYSTASELAADLQRYLKREPVLAGPPSAFYRAKKAMVRHRRAFAVAALLFLILAGAAVASTLLFLDANRAWRVVSKQRDEVRAALVDTAAALRREEEARGKALDANEAMRKALAEARQNLGMAFLERARTALEGGDRRAATLYAAASVHARDGLEARTVLARASQSVPREPDWVVPGSPSFRRLAFSPDGKHLVSAESRRITVWDAENGRRLWHHERPILARAQLRQGRHAPIVFLGEPWLRFARSGELYFVDGEGWIHEWDLSRGELVGSTTIDSTESESKPFALHPTEPRLAALRENKIVLVKLEPHDQRRTVVFATDEDEGDVLDLVFRHDGSLLAACAGDDGSVAVREAESGDIVRNIDKEEAEGSFCLFGPRGEHIAFGKGGEVRVYSLGTGEKKKLRTDEVHRLAFDPHGRLLACAGLENGDELISVWDWQSGRRFALLRGHEGEVDSMAFSPDGKRLASSSDADESLRVWDIRQSAEVFRLRSGLRIESLGFLPDGTRLETVEENGRRQVRDVESGRLLLEAPETERTELEDGYLPPFAAEVDPGAHVLIVKEANAGNDRGQETRWREVARLPLPKGEVTCKPVVSPAGDRVALGLAGHGCLVWIAARADAAPIRPEVPWNATVERLAFSPDGSRLAVGYADGRVIEAFPPHWDGPQELVRPSGSSVRDLVYSSDGLRLLVRTGDSFHLIDAAGLGVVRVLKEAHRPHKYRPHFSRSGNWCVIPVNDVGVLEVWNATTGQTALQAGAPEDPGTIHLFRGQTPRAWAFSPDERRFAVAFDDGSLRLWSLEAHRESLPARAFHARDWVEALAFDPAGRKVAVTRSTSRTSVVDLDGEDSLILAEGDPHPTGVQLILSMHLRFDAQGKRLLGSNSEVLRLFDLRGGEPRTKRFSRRPPAPEVFSVSPDGRWIAMAVRDFTRFALFDTETGKELRRFEGHAGAVTALAFSPDATRIASGSHDRTVRIWETASGLERARLIGHASRVRRVSWSPKGDRLLSTEGAYYWQKVILWNLESGKSLLDVRAGNDRLGFDAHGEFLCIQRDQNLELWHTASGKEARRWQVPWYSSADHVVPIFGGQRMQVLHVSKKEQRAPEVTRWDVLSGENIEGPLPLPEFEEILNADPAGRQLLLLERAEKGKASSVVLWDLIKNRELAAWTASRKPNADLFAAFGAGGDVVAYADGEGIRAYDCKSGSILWSTHPASLRVRRLALSKDGRCLAALGWQPRLALHVWKLSAEEDPVEIPIAYRSILEFTFDRDGRALALVRNHPAPEFTQLVDLETEEALARFRFRPEEEVIALSPDGSLLATEDTGEIRLYSTSSAVVRRRLAYPSRTGRPDEALAGSFPRGRAWGLFGPRSRAFAAGGGSRIVVWNLSKGQPIGVVEERKVGFHGPEKIALSADGRWLANLGEEMGSVSIWEVEKGAKRLIIAPSPAMEGGEVFIITAFELDPRGRSIAYAETWANQTGVLPRGHTRVLFADLEFLLSSPEKLLQRAEERTGLRLLETTARSVGDPVHLWPVAD